MLQDPASPAAGGKAGKKKGNQEAELADDDDLL